MDRIIKTGVCSYGMSGTVFHVPFLHVHPGFEFTAVLERSKNLAKEKYPDVKVYRSLEEMLQDSSLDLIVVNTPNYTHFDYTKAALEAGKNVIVEKPFTVTYAEGETLIALAKEKGLFLSVYQNRRYDGDYKLTRQIVQSGVLGDILEAEIHYDRFREELSYKKHKEVANPGTGSLYDLGPHIIDQALLLFGMPQKIWADIRIIRKDSLVDDYFELVFFYENLRARIKCSYLVREPLPSYQFHGRIGSFIKTKSDIQEAMLQKGLLPNTPDWGAEAPHEWGLLHTEKDGKVLKQLLPSPNGNYMEYYDGVYNALAKGADNPVPPAESLRIIKIIEAAFKSSREGRVVEIV